MKIIFVSACRNAVANQDALCASIDAQDDPRWEHVIIDDASDNDLMMNNAANVDARRTFKLNPTRRWALHNVVDAARQYEQHDDVIIATVDGDDSLCNDKTVGLVLSEYERDQTLDVLWTGQQWDIDQRMNVSRAMPTHVDPYDWPWCASHLRTWRASTLARVPDANFVDHDGHWFKRGYDQALTLPLLHVARARKYLPTVCYTYKMDSASISLRDRPGTEVEQLSSIAFIRARGFVG